MPSNGNQHSLSVEQLQVRYGSVVAVTGVSFTMERGTVISIFGPNGAGKSSLLGALSGVVPADQGQVRLNGIDVTRMPAPARARLGVAHVLEGRGVFPDLSVADNLKVAYHGSRRSRSAALEEAAAQFPILGERWRQRASNLSGGEQQMLVLARALLVEPAFLLVDEPCLGLAPMVVEEVLSRLSTLKARGLGIILVEQPLAGVLDITDRCIILQKGRVVGETGPEEINRDSDRMRAALGLGIGRAQVDGQQQSER